MAIGATVTFNDNRPVAMVSLQDIQEFVNSLNEHLQEQTEPAFSLPAQEECNYTD